MEEERTYQDIPLSSIKPSPHNPRKKFGNMEKLTASVRAKGVIVPLLLRPLPGSKKLVKSVRKATAGFEIVSGERRYRAALAVAQENSGPGKYLVPSIVQNLSDDDAFDIMTIENLQRDDLTELEEARSFKSWLDRKGEAALPELAERLSINPRYIKRRLAVLALPDAILAAWEDGKIHYGHLEQLVRVVDAETRKALFNQTVGCPLSVGQLKGRVENMAPNLNRALFRLKEAGCPKCPKNTAVQRDLFGDSISDLAIHCMDPACFKQKQNNWLLANWEAFREKHKLQTTGFRFQGSVHWNDYETIHDKPKAVCRDCQKYITLMNVDGAVWFSAACFDKNKTCYHKTYQTKTGRRGSVSAGASRASQHGLLFRERFYQSRIPEIMEALPEADVRVMRISLLAILESNRAAALHFVKLHNNDGKEGNDPWAHCDMDRAWNIIKSYSVQQIMQLQKELARLLVLSGETTDATTRHAVAAHLGIDLQQEWRMNLEYLEKKTIGEIHTLAAQFGFWKDAKAQAYLYEVLGRKRGKFENCKKGELIKIILESGIDLAGRVPAEILAVNGAKEAEEDDDSVEDYKGEPEHPF